MFTLLHILVSAYLLGFLLEAFEAWGQLSSPRARQRRDTCRSRKASQAQDKAGVILACLVLGAIWPIAWSVTGVLTLRRLISQKIRDTVDVISHSFVITLVIVLCYVFWFEACS